MADYMPDRGDIKRQCERMLADALATPEGDRDAVTRALADLADAAVTFQVVLAYPTLTEEGEAKGPALKHAGYPAAALVKLNSYKDRVRGLPDFTLFLDGDAWGQYSDRRKEALLAHELYHVLVRRDDSGAVLPDNAGRPKLKLRPHDVVVGAFTAVMKKYGDDALDTQQVKDAVVLVQATFAFAGEAPEIELPAALAVG